MSSIVYSNVKANVIFCTERKIAMHQVGRSARDL